MTPKDAFSEFPNWLPAFPWEGPPVPRHLLERNGTPEREMAPRPIRVHADGPGCKAADACLLVHSYLVNLAEGKSGFGVLRVGKDRLEEGAAGAARMGRVELAREMLKVAQELPLVKTPKAAEALAPRLKELSDQTWDLGRRCGGHG